MVPAHHRVQRGTARCAEDAGPLARAGQADAGELDRPLGRRAGRVADRRGGRDDRGFHDAAGHAVRRLVPGAVAASSAGAETGGERSGIAGVHRRMRPARHQRGGHRGGRKARLSHEARSGAPVRREPAGAGLCREFRADGIRHRRDFRLPGARPARPRFRAQIRAAGHSGDFAGRTRTRQLSRSATPPMSRTGSRSTRIS